MQLYQKGAILVEIGEQEYALVYKGEKLIQGTSKDKKLLAFYRNLKKVSRKSINIEAFLEKNLDNAKFLNTVPENCEIIVEKSSYILKDLSTKEEIGLVLLNDGYLEFAIYRKGLKTRITGQQIFISLIEYLKLKKISFKGVKGLWSISSDNTLAFNESIKKGLSKEEAAFETWTGKRAFEQGFDKVKIDNLVPEKPPYTSIIVTFYK